MRAVGNILREELRPTVALAGPVVIGQLGMMLMNLVDTAMVGRLGPEAVTSVGVAASIHSVVFTLGLGMLLSLDRVVSFAHGAGKREDVRQALVQGLWLATLVSVPLTILLLGASTQLARLHVEPRVVADSGAYLRALAWSLWPSLLFTAMRQSLQAIHDTHWATGLLLFANVVNALGNKLLIYGGFGLPALGTPGSGWATLASRVFLAVALGWHAWRVLGRGGGLSFRPDTKQLGELLRLGLPAGGQMLAEVGVFALVTLLAARLGDVAGAAHQIVLQIASFTFMVPLGISAAGSVRVGQALGRGDPAGARRAGWAAVLSGVGFMLFSGAALLAFGRFLVGAFHQPEEVIVLAERLLVCAGLFQIMDGAQVTLAGVLRGANDTVSSMLANLVGHWCLGLPVGCLLCYGAAFGVVGLWVGLATGLAAVAVALAILWHRRITNHLVRPALES